MKLCQTIAVPTLKALRAERDEVRPGGPVSLVELRLDHLAPGELDVAGALEGRRLPVIVTCRPVSEGGRFAGSEEARLRVLREAARLGAEFVDVEFGAAVTLTNTRTVLSRHRFELGLPDDLADRIRAMRARASALPGAIVKVAVAVERPRECVTFLKALYGDQPPDANTIGIAMGPAGALSRMLPARFSGAWTYAGSAAPGQFSVADMVTRFRVHETTITTRVFGIAGAPLSHSASPAMHNAAFQAAGLDAIFVPVETAGAGELRELADALAIEGLAVTAPLKTQVMAWSDPDEDCRAIGAANTLKRAASGVWEARNFDAPAFAEPLQTVLRDPRGLRVIVVGAGGAARAAVSALTKLGARVEVSARNTAKATALADAFGASVTAFPPAGRAALVVNATPVGTGTNPEPSPISAGTVNIDVAYDLVYNPEHTAFLTEARSAGAQTIGGLAMLVAQARRQFEWWTGQTVPESVFEHAAREFIQ
jgi:3-dehydroquinate dehydratase/shikimate dehydrogenase